MGGSGKIIGLQCSNTETGGTSEEVKVKAIGQEFGQISETLCQTHVSDTKFEKKTETVLREMKTLKEIQNKHFDELYTMLFDEVDRLRSDDELLLEALEYKKYQIYSGFWWHICSGLPFFGSPLVNRRRKKTKE